MGDELSVAPGELVSLKGEKTPAEIIRPLMKEIHLFDSYIAGTTHLKDKTVLEKIKDGDKLTLQREDNKYDSNAVMVLTGDKEKVGYVPEKDNIVFARLMDAGKLLTAKINKVEKKGEYIQIKIGIYLVDF